MVTEHPPRTETDNAEGRVFDPIVVVDFFPMSDVIVLSDESEDNCQSNSTMKNNERVVISSSDNDEPGPSTSNTNGTNAKRERKRTSKMSDESEYDESQSGSEEEESIDGKTSEENSRSDYSEETPVRRSRNSRSMNSRKRRLASISSLSSVESTPPASPGKKHDKRTAESDSSVESGSPRKRNTKRRRIQKMTDDEEEEDKSEGEVVEDGADGTQKKRRGRRLLTREELAKETIDAEDAERERRLRLEQRQKEFNGIEFADDQADGLKKLKAIVLDDDKTAENPNPVHVHPQLVKLALPHQADGIRFMYECVVESLELFRKDPTGGGGILAHCMGLGKTFSTITFIHTVLSHSELKEKISKVLVVVPKNVVLNWKNEFDKWLASGGRYLDSFDVMELDSFKGDNDRLICLKNWHSSKKPSVMIIGYDMFRILTQCDEDRKRVSKLKQTQKPKKISKKQKRFLELQNEFRKYLQDPGPDLVICDEGHKLKNDESILSRTMMRIKTKRRICLTGTPLQNNLIEYHVMVSFVKPGLLGTKSEFSNRFANPINRGRTKDALPSEVRFMRRRCHVLFERLKNIVQRKEISVLKSELPEKQEFVLYIRMTEPQIELYEIFLKSVDKEIKLDLRKRLLADYHQLSRIWTHPYQLIAHAREQERKAILAEDMDGFIVDSEEEETGSDVDLDEGDSEAEDESRPKTRGTRKSNRLAGVEVDSRPPTPLDGTGWWTAAGVVSEADMFNLEMSNKLTVLFDIIKRCEAIGDKLLVFSQSLESLRLIRFFLEHFDKTNSWFIDGHECLAAKGEKWGWKEGRDYLVIDGSVGCHDREALQYTFNNKKQLRARLMLISTRAGSLGTNMIAANRVVIFDACWNPSHDTQSLFRIYRIGQVKPSYIYRLIAQGTMEERIYKRQVTKESTALRVVDEYQIQRHFHGHDLEELYCFDPKPYSPGTQHMAPPKDKLLAEVILTHPQCVVDYIVHDSLFENQEDEKLSAEECAAAWEDYEREKRGMPSTIPNNNISSNTTGFGMDPALATFVRQDAIFGIAVVAGFTEFQAIRLAYIKIVLHKLLEKAPQAGILEFGVLITNIMKHFKGEAAVAEAVRLFRTSEPYFKRTGANEMLDRLRIYSAWLFDHSNSSNGSTSLTGSLFP